LTRHLELAGFQDLEQRNPVDAGGLHRHCFDPAAVEPVRQPMEIFGECGECWHRFRIDQEARLRRFPLHLCRLLPHWAARSAIRLYLGPLSSSAFLLATW
jgi:hypothetical protein